MVANAARKDGMLLPDVLTRNGNGTGGRASLSGGGRCCACCLVGGRGGDSTVGDKGPGVSLEKVRDHSNRVVGAIAVVARQAGDVSRRLNDPD
jgi:hypothetical protein